MGGTVGRRVREAAEDVRAELREWFLGDPPTPTTDDPASDPVLKRQVLANQAHEQDNESVVVDLARELAALGVRVLLRRLHRG